MSSLRWKLRRLRAMSPGELALRAWQALQERLQPLPNETPTQTWRRLYPDADPSHCLHLITGALSLKLPLRDSQSLAGVLEEANALLRGAWSLFGYPVQLDDPPVWRRNYLLGKDWRDAPAKTIDYRRNDVAGGVKYVWELSRGQPLLHLACAYALMGTPEYAHTCRRWLLNWIETNPRGWSIHWTSALEHAIRVFAWSYALAAIYPTLASEESLTVLGALVQHGEFIERHLSVGSSANNHRIGEAAALAFLGNLLPPSPVATRWRKLGYAILEQEAIRQFHPDGVNAEQAFGYLPFVWEFYLHAYRLQPIPDAVAERLRKSIEFVRSVMDASGYVPQVGDEDDGTVVPLWSTHTNRYRVVGRALAHLLHCEPPPALDPADDALCLWLFSETPSAGSRLTESRLYPEGGYAVLHKGPWQVLFDAGPLGLGSLAAHGHADVLSVWASLEGKPLLIDAGTYAYHEDPEWRNHFRSTCAHNTLTLDNLEQSEILGPFLWGRKARAWFTAHDLSQPKVEGTTDAYVPHQVYRRIQLNAERLLVEDTLHLRGMARFVHWHWHFHPDWQVEPTADGWHITDGTRVCLLRVEGLPPDTQAHLYRGDEQAKLGWYSPRFGHKIPCTTLRIVVPVPGKANVVQWEFAYPS